MIWLILGCHTRNAIHSPQSRGRQQGAIFQVAVLCSVEHVMMKEDQIAVVSRWRTANTDLILSAPAPELLSSLYMADMIDDIFLIIPFLLF